MAIAEEEGTTVLAVGGWRDRPFQPSGWEWCFEAEPHAHAGRFDEAIAIMRDGLDQLGESGPGLYHLARYQAKAGRHEEAVASLGRALELRPDLRGPAVADDDLRELL